MLLRTSLACHMQVCSNSTLTLFRLLLCLIHIFDHISAAASQCFSCTRVNCSLTHVALLMPCHDAVVHDCHKTGHAQADESTFTLSARLVFGELRCACAGNWRQTACSKCLPIRSTWLIHYQPSRTTLRQHCLQQQRPSHSREISSVKGNSAAINKQAQSQCKVEQAEAAFQHMYDICKPHKQDLLRGVGNCLLITI